jgi:zinc transport system substrate-binding protein
VRLLRAPLPLVLLLLAACGGNGSATAPLDEAEQLQAVAALYPYAYLLERVGGDDVEVQNLTPAGAEPHDLELSPRQVALVAEADLVLHSRGFTPALDDAVDQHAADRAVDVLEHVDGGGDPHVWLDPDSLAAIATAVAEELGRRSPERASAFRERAEELRRDLAALDERFRGGLAQCERRDVVTSHDAFGHLTRRYGLEQVPVTGLSPEAEPSVRRLAEVATTARERGVTTIFFEETVSPRVAEQLAREVGATAAVLSPLEGPPADGDYLTAMDANLEALRSALGCS